MLHRIYTKRSKCVFLIFSAMSRRVWQLFFEEAGVSHESSKKYAKKFHENKIAMDMLLELNKDYLRDLGITSMDFTGFNFSEG